MNGTEPDAVPRAATPRRRVDRLGVAALTIACIPIVVVIAVSYGDAGELEHLLTWSWLLGVPPAFVLGAIALVRRWWRGLPLLGCGLLAVALSAGEAAFVAFVMATFPRC